MFKKLLSNKVSNESGFTLVEFLIVLAAVGIVTAGALAVLKPIFGKSRTAAAVSSINNLKANAMIYASYNMNSFANISINGTAPSMVSESILGNNWTTGSYADETASVECTATTQHCDPWGWTYYIAPGPTNSVFTISLGGVPENDAYNIASQFWNSDDNNPADTDAPTGSTTGTEFIGTTTVWMSPGNPATLTVTPGILTIYFSE